MRNPCWQQTVEPGARFNKQVGDTPFKRSHDHGSKRVALARTLKPKGRKRVSKTGKTSSSALRVPLIVGFEVEGALAR